MKNLFENIIDHFVQSLIPADVVLVAHFHSPVFFQTLGDRFFAAALRAMAWSGRLVVVGFAAGDIPTMKVNYLMLKNIHVSGLQVSDYRKRMPSRMKECFNDIFSLYEKGQLKPPTMSIRPLNEFAGALEEIRSRKAKERIVLVP